MRIGLAGVGRIGAEHARALAATRTWTSWCSPMPTCGGRPRRRRARRAVHAQRRGACSGGAGRFVIAAATDAHASLIGPASRRDADLLREAGRAGRRRDPRRARPRSTAADVRCTSASSAASTPATGGRAPSGPRGELGCVHAHARRAPRPGPAARRRTSRPAAASSATATCTTSTSSASSPGARSSRSTRPAPTRASRSSPRPATSTPRPPSSPSTTARSRLVQRDPLQRRAATTSGWRCSARRAPSSVGLDDRSPLRSAEPGVDLPARRPVPVVHGPVHAGLRRRADGVRRRGRGATPSPCTVADALRGVLGRRGAASCPAERRTARSGSTEVRHRSTPARRASPGRPISWGVCEVPGWGYQLDRRHRAGRDARARAGGHRVRPGRLPAGRPAREGGRARPRTGCAPSAASCRSCCTTRWPRPAARGRRGHRRPASRPAPRRRRAGRGDRRRGVRRPPGARRRRLGDAARQPRPARGRTPPPAASRPPCTRTSARWSRPATRRSGCSTGRTIGAVPRHRPPAGRRRRPGRARPQAPARGSPTCTSRTSTPTGARRCAPARPPTARPCRAACTGRSARATSTSRRSSATLEGAGYAGWYVLEQDVMLDGRPRATGAAWPTSGASLDFLRRWRERARLTSGAVASTCSPWAGSGSTSTRCRSACASRTSRRSASSSAAAPPTSRSPRRGTAGARAVDHPHRRGPVRRLRPPGAARLRRRRPVRLARCRACRRR